ncbi:sialate O-acetylesterase [Aestuariivivens sediminis]|uniref:sialate O-acetylesterase n=1 Tax=Aestuariivivens sediminis TaxID=2913557 RepID=UPI001F5A3B55|nr:sialate O-acetylesterase [Aestuariivivens sediminis]
MKNFILTVFLFSIMVACSAAQNPEDSKHTKKVFLFAGQSNMDGRASGDVLSENDLARLEKVANRIDFYYNHKPVSPLQLSSASKFIENKFGFTQIFGPELFFGIEMAEKYPDDEFIFIKRSIGGTSLYGCWNPDWTLGKANQMDEADKPKLYSGFIEYTQSILNSFDENDYEIKGMLWVQGEADSNINNYGEEPSITYGQNLKNLINSVREDLEVPNMPFALFQVGQGKVVEGMIDTANNDDEVFLIPQSEDENSEYYYEQYPPPKWHYTTESMKRIGIEFFKIYDKIYK